jgi:thioredoxin-dependent peroxiredoxin
MPASDPNSIPALSSALELEGQDARGETHRLRDFHGHNVVVYFYPKDDTPGCTVEGKEFRDSIENFKALDCVVICVSTGSAERHRAFAEKHALPFILLADEDGKLASAFGVLNGKYAARSTFVLDTDLRVRRAFHEVTPRGHAAQVLAFMRTLVESHRMIGG